MRYLYNIQVNGSITVLWAANEKDARIDAAACGIVSPSKVSIQEPRYSTDDWYRDNKHLLVSSR